MMMKRAHILCCPALLGLVACERTPQQPEGDEIRFTASMVGVSTRAISSVPHDQSYLLKEGNEAVVYGAYISETGQRSDVFAGVTLTCSHNTSEWTYEGERKNWEKTGGAYDFKALFPLSMKEKVASSTDGHHLTIPYSMHTDNYDFMVASEQREMSSGYLGPVALPFRHATAAVRFLFCKGNDVEENYTLNSFELRNLLTVGELIYETGELEYSSWHRADYRAESVCEWEAGSEGGPISIPKKQVLNEEFPGDWKYAWIYAIPQSLMVEDEESAPAVHFSIYMGSNLVETTLELPNEDASFNPILWKPGYVYNYTVEVNPKNASIYVSVQEWESYKVAVDDVVFGGQ